MLIVIGLESYILYQGPLVRYTNNDHILLYMGWMSDSEQCLNRLELDLISLLVNFACGLGQIMTRYTSVWTRKVILSNVTNLPQLDQILL